MPSFTVDISPSKLTAAEHAARAAAEILRACIARRGSARVLVATGNSQLDMMRVLTSTPGIEWGKVDAFHLDEYVGISATHPASFRLWIRNNFELEVRPRSMHYIEGDAANLDATLDQYSRMLRAATIDLAFVGIGENGHIAFNDPHVADFNDPLAIKRVALDVPCRMQQVGEGHFPNLEAVPREACSVTCSELMRAAHWVCCVPDQRKAKAVRGSLEGPVSPTCPGSLVQRHPSAAVFLDSASASLLSPAYVKSLAGVERPAAAGARR